MNNTVSPNESDLTVAIDELRARYARCNNAYDNLQTKFFALLAGQLTVAALLFSGYFNGQSLGMPDELYGRVIFFTAVAMMLVAIGLAILSVSSNSNWAETPEIRRILDNDEIAAHPGEKFLKRIKCDYEEAIAQCEACINERAQKLDWSIRLSVGSIIIFLMLKIGA